MNIAITSEGSPVVLNVYRFLRRNLESIVPLGVGAILIWQQPSISANFISKDWDIDAFYSAVFDWSSIQAAFLFSVYAFFLSRSEPFIQAIAKTQPFTELRRYVLRALSLSILLSLISLPLLVSAPDFEQNYRTDFGFIAFSGILVFLTFTFMCFVKVIRVFHKLERYS